MTNLECSSVQHVAPRIHRGKIKLIIGPMFARKTSSMIGEIERYIAAKKHCAIVKHLTDDRYDNVSSTISMVTHGGNIFNNCPIVRAKLLKDVDGVDILNASDVIAISEGQFYSDLAHYVNKWANAGKIIVIEGLSGDFQQRPFEPIAEVTAIADSIVHLKAVCMRCYENDGSFTIRTTTDTDRVIVGGSNMYLAVCRQCLIN